MDKGYIIKLLENLKDIMMTNKDYLIQLDSVVGDGDLGLTMSDGFLAAYNAVKDTDEGDIGKIIYAAGKAMSTAVPSTMGTLMASGFMNAGKVLKGTTEVTLADIANLFDAYLEGVAARGKAKLGDKTFLDGLAPAVASLKASAKNQDTLEHAAADAAYAAEEGFMHTNQLLAVHGRAATRGEDSRKLLDPGAAVAMLMMKAFHKSVH